MSKLTDGMGKALEVELGLRAEIARLQERVEEAEVDVWRWKKAKGESDGVIRRVVALVPRDVEREDIFAAVKRTVRERDGWEALAKVRGEALEGLLDYVIKMAARTVRQPKEMLPDKRIGVARDAIAMTPEEARP